MPQIESKALLRYLRIAWLMFIGVICLSLIALWVRSYWHVDGVYVAHTHCAISMWGMVYIDAQVTCPASLGPSKHDYGPHVTHATWIVGKGLALTEQRAVIPFWLLILSIAACMAIPWFWWQFSLRALLFLTTLVAVVLGLIVWAFQE